MKHFFAVLMLMFLFSPSKIEAKSETPEEASQIISALEKYYIKGLKDRDFSLIRAICIEEAKLYSVLLDSSLSIITLDKWSKRFDPDNPPFKTLDYEISEPDYEGTAAQVKIRFVVDRKTVIHDYLHLLKIKGEWRIVNIIDF